MSEGWNDIETSSVYTVKGIGVGLAYTGTALTEKLVEKDNLSSSISFILGTYWTAPFAICLQKGVNSRETLRLTVKNIRNRVIM